MTATISAIYDGAVFVPDEPVDLPLQAKCLLVVQSEEKPPAIEQRELVDHQWLLDQIDKLPPAGLPEDAAAQHDHYLYGLPKR